MSRIRSLGRSGNCCRLVQDFCQSVLGLPISLGAMQKGIDRTAAALVPS